MLFLKSLARKRRMQYKNKIPFTCIYHNIYTYNRNRALAKCISFCPGIRIKPRYFLKAQGQSFHLCILILCFLAVFAIAKIVFVGRHRTHITKWSLHNIVRMDILYLDSESVTDRTFALHSDRRLLLCATKYSLKCWCSNAYRFQHLMQEGRRHPLAQFKV